MKRLFASLALAGLVATGAIAQEPVLDETDRAAQLLEQGFRTTAEVGVKEALPVHTVNRRPTGKFDRLAPPPEPGTGRRMTVHSTAYCLQGFTARGTRVELGTIAVDPRVIPMGSLIYVHGYGWGRALDTGGAVRGNFIDVWFPSASQCYQWGTRSVQIVVFPPEKR